MATEAREVLDEYLEALDAELKGLPAADRAELILEVRTHFEEARRELPAPTEAQLRNILERLGPPSEIAAEARQRYQSPALPSAAPELAEPARTAGLLEILALLTWVVWWPAGVVLTSLSPKWSRRTKATAILIEILIFGVAWGFMATPAYLSPPSFGFHPFWIFFVALMPPSLHGLGSVAYLSWKLAHPVPKRWSEPWRVAGRTGIILLGGWLAWSLVIGPVLLLAMHAR